MDDLRTPMPGAEESLAIGAGDCARMDREPSRAGDCPFGLGVRLFLSRDILLGATRPSSLMIGRRDTVGNHLADTGFLLVTLDSSMVLTLALELAV